MSDFVGVWLLHCCKVIQRDHYVPTCAAVCCAMALQLFPEPESDDDDEEDEGMGPEDEGEEEEEEEGSVAGS
jgi:hypothetical protein